VNIKIKSLGVDKLSEKSLDGGYLYKDIALDMNPAVSFNNQLSRHEYYRDISAIFDIEAVKNSIKNAFLTSPGQKILNPTYGVDLRQFLFEPVSDFIADIIKDDIQNKLPIMEPRVEIKKVRVVEDEDNNQYNISFQINVPSLDIVGLSIKSELNSTGYTVI